MNIQKIEHNDQTHFNITIEDAKRLGLPDAVVNAAVTRELTLAYEAEIDRLGDMIAVSPSRAARYETKRAQANAYIAAGRPEKPAEGDYAMLTLEAAARGVTPALLADLVIARAEAFDLLMANAEALRASLGQIIGAAEGATAKQSAAEAAISPFRAAISAALAG